VTTLGCGSRSLRTLRAWEHSQRNVDPQPEESVLLRLNGANDTRDTMDSILEMEHRLNSLRLLVCELLKTNQELRDALQEARSGGSDAQGTSSRKSPIFPRCFDEQ
jgi:hypothetical protein